MNLASVWLRGRLTGRMSGFYLVSAGAVAIVVSKMTLGWENAADWGVALTLAGSLLSALSATNGRSPFNRLLKLFALKHEVEVSGRPGSRS